LSKIKLESEWELGEVWYDLKLENKPFKAIHKPSGEVFEQKVLHWFADDMGLDINTISKILAGKKDKNGNEYVINQWEFKYAS
jgi:predicted DsbA family dithiol-disulfide isomerase